MYFTETMASIETVLQTPGSGVAIVKKLQKRVDAELQERYPLLKDESAPVQVKLAVVPQKDLSSAIAAIRRAVEQMDESAEKFPDTPPVGHELFKLGGLTDKVPQFHLLAAGNPKPESLAISPLYQITIGERLKREPVGA